MSGRAVTKLLRNADIYSQAAERARDAGNMTAFVELISLAAMSVKAARNFEEIDRLPPDPRRGGEKERTE